MFFNHGDGMAMTEKKHSKIRPFWGLLGTQSSKFPSTMVKVGLWRKTVKLGHSGALLELKVQKFLQPWWRYDYDIKH